MSRAGYLIAIAIASGCVGDVAIGRGVCGNWVLEPGEDCDRPDGVCTADCRIHCNPVAPARCFGAFDGACCPEGFACGVDQACHAPGGALATAPISVPVDLTAFRVSDLDGDHIGDVLGVGPDAVHALYGSTRAPLSSATTRHAPASTGVPAIGDYTGDGRLDIVWPVADGLLAFDTTSGGPEPVQFPSGITPGVDHLRIAAVGSNLVRLDFRSTDNQLVIVDDRGHPTHVLCGTHLREETLRGRSIHPYDDGGLGAHIMVPVRFAPQNPGEPPRVCLDGPSAAGGALLNGPPGTNAPEIGEAFFAKLDPTQACPDLLVPLLSNNVPILMRLAPAVTSVAGSCSTGALALASVGAPLAPLVLANGDTAIVTTAGVFEASAACPDPVHLCQVLSATRTWRYAVVADFDGDGRDDFAVASAEADVEVFFQDAVGWSERRIATAGAGVDLVPGDFDGDGALDLAIAVADPADPRTAYVSFAFGSARAFAISGAPLAFAELNGMALAQLTDPATPPTLRGTDDLALVSGTNAQGALTFVYGAPDRIPTAPWIYIGQFGDFSSHPGRGLAAIVGPFGPDNAPGVLGLFAPSPSEATLPSDTLELANLTSSFGTLSAARQSWLGPCVANNFCPAAATFATVARPDGALVLGFAVGPDSADCGGSYFSTPQSIPQFAPLACTDASGTVALRGVTSARVVDGDGTTAAQIAIGTSAALTVWTVGVAGGMPTFDMPFDLTAAIGQAIGGAVSCFDAVAIELGTERVDDIVYGAGRELAVACHVGAQTVVFAIFAPAPGPVGPIVRQLFAIDDDGPIALEVGDVDGDGVDDLLYTTRTGGVAMLHVRLQCDTHATCAP